MKSWNKKYSKKKKRKIPFLKRTSKKERGKYDRLIESVCEL